MTYTEDQYLMISGLQHIAFCPRQCALIHLEQAWNENVLTALGRDMHDRVHTAGAETRADVRTVRGMRLSSSLLGLTGIADVVEFHLTDDQAAGVKLPHRRGLWIPYPVEYKHGQPKKGNCDAVQLCAQALCLEEALGVSIPEGALFYGQTRQRTCVVFDNELRSQTRSLAERFHQLIDEQIIPPPTAGKHCQACSMLEICQPKVRADASLWIEQMIQQNIKETLS